MGTAGRASVCAAARARGLQAFRGRGRAPVTCSLGRGRCERPRNFQAPRSPVSLSPSLLPKPLFCPPLPSPAGCSRTHQGMHQAPLEPLPPLSDLERGSYCCSLAYPQICLGIAPSKNGATQKKTNAHSCSTCSGHSQASAPAPVHKCKPTASRSRA